MPRNGEIQENVGYTTVYVDYGKRTKKSLITYGLALEIFSLIMLTVHYTAPDMALNGTTLASLEWLVGIIASIAGLIFYVIEAVIAILKERSTFRVIKLLAVLVSSAVLIFIGIKEVLICEIIWIIVYVILGVIEGIAVYRYHNYLDFE